MSVFRNQTMLPSARFRSRLILMQSLGTGTTEKLLRRRSSLQAARWVASVDASWAQKAGGIICDTMRECVSCWTAMFLSQL